MATQMQQKLLAPHLLIIIIIGHGSNSHVSYNEGVQIVWTQGNTLPHRVNDGMRVKDRLSIENKHMVIYIHNN